MAALPASGGVRSLLAKFENTNNNNNNPEVSPSRGRHSGDSQDNAPNRPLSKVRASFVSVERNGQGSPTPGALRRTESYNTDVDSNHRSATVSPTGQLETALASPFSASPHKIRTALAAFQGDRVETVNAKLASFAVKDNVQPPKVTEKLETTPQLLQPAIIEKPTEKPANTTSTKQTAPPKTIKKSASTMSIVKESSANKNPIRAATVKERKPAVTPTRSATTTTRPTAHSDKPTGNRTTAVKSSAPVARAQRASTPSHDVPKRPTVQPSPKTKPASKSPTRPVRLPASLVTPTAASAARTGTLARSQSHVNLRSSPKAEPAKTLSRKPSTLRPDTSRLGTHTIPDRPRSRVSTTSSRAPQEESFLARMMRPTASSASKMHDKVEPRSPPRLAVAVKLTPKKETPTKTAEDKKEKHEKTSQDSTPAISQAKIERVATGQAAIKKDAAFENCHHVEPPALAKEESQKEAEVSTADPSSDPIVTEPAVISAAEPASERVVEDSKPEATAAQSSTEPKAIEEVVEEPQTQAIQASDADAINEKSLASVPETVPEEPESDVKEAALEATSETDPLHDNQQDSITEPVLEASVPQEEISNKTEEITEDQDKLAEPEQSTEESVQHATEETPAKPAKKAEESLQSASTDESLEPTTEKTEKEVEPTLEGDN